MLMTMNVKEHGTYAHVVHWRWRWATLATRFPENNCTENVCQPIRFKHSTAPLYRTKQFTLQKWNKNIFYTKTELYALGQKQ